MGLSHFSRRSIRSPILPLQHPCCLSLSQKRTKKQKKMQSLIIVLLVVVGTYAERKTSTGVDLEPIFDFLDDDDNAQVNFNELKALTSTGDADVDGVDGSDEDGVIRGQENVKLFE